MKKLRVGILFGGRSGEHEVSLLSAASVLQAIDKNKYEVVPIGITKDGHWLTAVDAENLLQGKLVLEPRQLRAGDPETTPAAAVLARGESVVVPPEPVHRESGLVPFQTEGALTRRASDRAINVDVIFPVLHGTFGEDGTAWEKEPKKVQKLVESKLKYPVFVKPANLGSSVGISKAHDRKELGPAIEEAARFDRKIVIEEGVGGKKHKAREIECSVLGNDEPVASLPGEVVPVKEFYDYNAKYLEEGSELIIPAKLTKDETKRVQELAVRSFKAVDCSGLARVDFLMEPGLKGKSRKIYLNEINTMPGFTAISMYPKLWAASGLEYADLIDKLIQLGLERHADKKRNQYSR